MTCPMCNDERQILKWAAAGSYLDRCPSCALRGRIHPLASIGDPPEHRDYISGKLEALYPGYSIGADCVISAFVTIDRGIWQPTTIGDRCLLMTKSHIGHDAQIGDDVEIGVGALISGHVVVGDGARIHGAASIRPGIKIGAGARIGLGAVVVKDVPAGEVWAGNPARRLEHGRVAAEMSLHQYATREPVEARGIPLPDYVPGRVAPHMEQAAVRNETLNVSMEHAREEYAERCQVSRDTWRRFA